MEGITLKYNVKKVSTYMWNLVMTCCQVYNKAAYTHKIKVILKFPKAGEKVERLLGLV